MLEGLPESDLASLAVYILVGVDCTSLYEFKQSTFSIHTREALVEMLQTAIS